MKKVVIVIFSLIIVVSLMVVINPKFAKTKNKESVNSNVNIQSVESVEGEKSSKSNLDTKKQDAQEKKRYDIIVSNKNITVEEGSETSFTITFTNPDEQDIREYIKCEDQDDIILVKYSDMDNKKITVNILGLKVGTTEILVCDYNYPDVKESVKVNVIQKK